MAGLFLTTKPLAPALSQDLYSSMSFSPKAWKSEYIDEQLHCILSRLDRKDLWAPAKDDKKKIYIYLSGRIALNKAEWEKGKNRIRRGGLAASHVIEEYLAKEFKFTETINGAFTILIIDLIKQKTFLITDRMGFYPIYLYKNLNHLTISSNFDTIAKFETNLEYDLITMSEMLKFGYSVQPYTYYEEIQQLDPACIYEIKGNEIIKLKQYWEPQPNFTPVSNKVNLINDLSNAINISVKLRSQELLGNTGLFLSVGADSRAILGAADNPDKIMSFTFYDVINNELNLATQISQAYGSKHIKLKRDEEHYGLWATKAAHIISGVWNIQDAHYTNFLETINSYNLDNFLSGCFADYFFKGIALNRAPIRFLKKQLPYFKTTKFAQEWYFNISLLESNYDKKANERNLSQYQGIDISKDDEINKWMIEKVRLFPISREATIGGRMLLYRTLPWDPVLSDNSLLEVYQNIPPSLKVNGEIWKSAVYNLSGKVSAIVDNNNLAPLNSSKFGIIYNFLKAVLIRKLTGKEIDGTTLGNLVTRGSWPNFYFYLKNSKILSDLWSNNDQDIQDLFITLLGYNPFKINTSKWADKDPMLFYRILTLKLWLENKFNLK